MSRAVLEAAADAAIDAASRARDTVAIVRDGPALRPAGGWWAAVMCAVEAGDTAYEAAGEIALALAEDRGRSPDDVLERARAARRAIEAGADVYAAAIAGADRIAAAIGERYAIARRAS